MSDPWYKSYFTEAYWRFAELEYSAERTTREVEYIARVLANRAPGRRLVDLGCGLGRHALSLARLGWDVIGLDMSSWAIEQVRSHSAHLGLEACWETVDLLTDWRWPLGQVDAALCIQSFGWGSDAEQRQFLRRVRRKLNTGGVLLLDYSNLLWIARHFNEEATAQIGDAVFHFVRAYEPLSGRNIGRIVVSRPGTPDVTLPHDVRLYSTPEILALLREAGFEIERIDADFQEEASLTLDTRYVQVLARAAAVPPGGLAGQAYARKPPHVLDLRWSPDEVEWVQPSPADIWVDFLNGEPRHAAEFARRYAMDDLYGGKEAVAVLETHFGCRISSESVTFGAGVASLLKDLSSLADGGTILSSRLGHPDLFAWARANGSEVHLLEEGAGLARWQRELKEVRPRLVLLDRPSITGEILSLEELEALGHEAAAVGTTLLVDEAYCAYFAGRNSAVLLVSKLDNLVVLRSLSKAYSWGGLRVGFAVASEPLIPAIREFVPPLQVSQVAYGMALRLLARGDIFAALRERIAAMKQVTRKLLDGHPFEVVAGHPELPWLILRDEDGRAGQWLQERGVLGKQFREWRLMKLAVPLSEERMSLLHECLG